MYKESTNNDEIKRQQSSVLEQTNKKKNPTDIGFQQFGITPYSSFHSKDPKQSTDSIRQQPSNDSSPKQSNNSARQQWNNDSPKQWNNDSRKQLFSQSSNDSFSKPSNDFVRQPSNDFVRQPSTDSSKQFNIQPSNDSSKQFIIQPTTDSSKQFNIQPSNDFVRQPSTDSSKQFIIQPSTDSIKQSNNSSKQQNSLSEIDQLTMNLSQMKIFDITFTEEKAYSIFEEIRKIEKEFPSPPKTQEILQQANYLIDRGRRTSQGEKICFITMQFLFPNYEWIRNKRPNWCKNPETGRNLELDVSCDQLNIAVEYNGAQHYQKNHQWSDPKQAYRDQVKKEACEREGWLLIIVPYWISNDRIPLFIYHELTTTIIIPDH